MVAKKKGRSPEDIRKEQAQQAEKSTALAKAGANTLAVADNPWIEIGAELDKYLGAPMLKFSKLGQYAISDIDTIPAGTKVVAHCDLMELGFVRWTDGKPTDRKTGLVADGFVPPQKSDLPDRDETLWEVSDTGEKRDPWSFQMSVPVTRLDAGGETFQFTVGSKGGLRCLSGLTRAYGKRVAEEKPGLPIIELQSDSYRHPRYGRIFFPVMHVVGWTGSDGKPQTLGEELNDALPDFDEKAA